ncbi:hypothetical protein MRX96_019102 [Rhipicephalus microplus]
MNGDIAIPLTYYAAASTSATDMAQSGRQPRQPDYWAPEPRIFSVLTVRAIAGTLLDGQLAATVFPLGSSDRFQSTGTTTARDFLTST